MYKFMRISVKRGEVQIVDIHEQMGYVDAIRDGFGWGVKTMKLHLLTGNVNFYICHRGPMNLLAVMCTVSNNLHMII